MPMGRILTEELSTLREELSTLTMSSNPKPRYVFPKFCINRYRNQLLEDLCPIITAREEFNIDEILEALNLAHDADASDPGSFEKMMEDFEKYPVTSVSEFKRIVLSSNVSELALSDSMKMSQAYFMKTNPVETKEQLIRVLRELKADHYLVFCDPVVFWEILLFIGCLSELESKHMLSYLMTLRPYEDISEFVDEHLETYDWDKHFPGVGSEDKKEETPEVARDPHFDLARYISDEIKNRTYDCVVCFDKVETTQKFWGCAKCHRVYHLECITDWHEWSSQCPTCAQKFHSHDLVFRCWCKKTHKPKANFVNPGSCGAVCGASIDGTGVVCTLVCHPGPHE